MLTDEAHESFKTVPSPHLFEFEIKLELSWRDNFHFFAWSNQISQYSAVIWLVTC